MLNLFADSILRLPAKTGRWRRTLVDKFPDDADRNGKAAETLEKLVTTDPDTVDGVIWSQLEQHAGTVELRDAVNTCAREVGFVYFPHDLSDFFKSVLSKLSIH